MSTLAEAEPFSRLDGRVKAAVAALGIVIFADVLGIVLDLVEASAAGKAADGDLGAFADMSTADHRRAIASWVGTATILLCAVFFIRWFAGAYRNLRPLGVDQLRFGEGWAVGAWFVPFLNLWRPKQIANDIWRGSSAGSDWTTVAVPGIVTAWWAAFIVQGIASGMATNGINLAETPVDLRDALYLDVVVTLVSIVAAVLAIQVVRRATALQHARAGELAAQAPEPAPTLFA